ncbi:MAG: ribose-phosphate diphosphokinase [Candidatus Methanomethylicus sp.]|nr:ribose-phosphate diphosphokinase [Candidatus Methanomethylicus sp.]
MIVMPGPSSVKLGEKVASIIGCPTINIEYKNFPDGESYQRITARVQGEDVALIHTTYPQQDKRLIELLLLIDNLKNLGASRVRVVVPYMAYARQDSRFREGEAVSIMTLFKLIEAAGADEFYTIDIHKEATLQAFRIKAKNLFATEVIADYLKKIDLKDPYILSPDKGAIMIAKRVGDELGTEYGNFEKTRDRITGAITVKGEKVDAAGRDVVICDDLISTGGTIANAAKILKDGGARKVLAVCSHPLLVAGAAERMRSAGVDEVLGTDTVESEIGRISVAPLLAKGIL